MTRRIREAFWRRKSRHQENIAEFGAPMREEFREHYAGEVAELFFANEGETVHKWLHYLPIYEQILAHRVATHFRFLEIGVSRGGLAALWRDYFGKDAILFGIDIDPACAMLDGRHGQVRIGSQDDPKFLRAVVAEMGGIDVVLDDGSHVGSHQRASYDALFPLLSDGGLYIIEDMHTAYWPHYEGGLRRPGTAIEFLKGKIDEMHQHYQASGRNRAELIPEIESIQFFDSIAVIHKRRQLPRHHVQIPDPGPRPG